MYYLDLRYPLPFNNNKFEGDFSEHTIEHLYSSEAKNLFKEIQANPELNSPLNFFPIINHDLEKYNSKYRNAEKSKIFSSVLFGFEKNSNDSSLLSGELIWKDNLKSNGKKLSKKLSKDLLNSKLRSEMMLGILA